MKPFFLFYIYIYFFPFSLFVSVYAYAFCVFCLYSFAFTICPRVLSVFWFFLGVVFHACYHWWICFWFGYSLLSFFFLFNIFKIFILIISFSIFFPPSSLPSFLPFSSLLHLPPSHPPHPTPLGGHKAPSWSPCAMRLLPTSYLFYIW